ncbi:hypothetical protein F2Q69_00060841 [Brassica cretica]|uniref:Uncharacterized protein n=1 Tax=Brassica cretica TaxID=69181 RepID=A0A8S9RN52_BRACR|nr:hypothetical protein F2Q69_00060841 [Brassica cretica]
MCIFLAMERLLVRRPGGTPGSKDTQGAVKKRSKEESVDLSTAVGVMCSWFQDSVLLTSKLGPSLIFSESSLRRGNGELS